MVTSPRFLAALLGGLGAWSIATPYVDGALGLELPVAAKVEVVDHVLPGALIVASGGAILLLVRGSETPRSSAFVLATAAAFLSGFWITSTHLPLLAQAARGESAWDASLFHTAAGPPIVVLSLWTLLLGLRAFEGAEAGG